MTSSTRPAISQRRERRITVSSQFRRRSFSRCLRNRARRALSPRPALAYPEPVHPPGVSLMFRHALFLVLVGPLVAALSLVGDAASDGPVGRGIADEGQRG